MLVNRITEVRNDIDNVLTLKSTDTENKNIVRGNNTFFSSYKMLKESIQSYVLTSEKMDFRVKDDTLKLLYSVMDSSKLIFDNQLVTRPESYKKESENIVAKLSNEWYQYIKDKNAPIVDSLNILKLVAESSKQIAIRNLQSDIKKCETWPINSDLLENYFAACEKAEEYRESMNFDDEIEDFLRKVSMKNATLLDITPKVMEWIEKEGFMEKIGLSIKA